MIHRISTLFLLKWPRKTKRLAVLLLDTSFSVLAVLISFYLRLDQFVPIFGSSQWQPLPAIIVSIFLSLPLFISSGFYRAIFRYSEFMALKTIAKTTAIYGVIYVFIFTVIGIDGVPRTVGLIQPILMLLLVGGSRIFAGYWLGGMYRKILHLDAPSRVVIYGSDLHAREIARTLAQNHEMRIVGFIEDDPTLSGGFLMGVKVYDSTDLKSLVKKLDATDVLLAIPLVDRQKRNQILNQLQGTGISVRTLPDIIDLAQGLIDISEMRELDIDDLLGRNPVLPDKELLKKNIFNEVVLVTGAGGSIGGELSLQILKQSPKILLLIDHSEFALYQILEKLDFIRAAIPGCDTRLIPLLGSVQDENRMGEIFSTWRPNSVFHAAAYKHVPLVEHSPIEGICNNVFGTYIIAGMAVEYGVSNMTLISTDKAVRPTNVMGASKRLSEMVLQAFSADERFSSVTKFSIVRFGNVLGSSGSVVPKFREQVRLGGPVTVTDPEVTRYFMTIAEASELVLQAAAMSKGGEVFLLDMGEPVRIVDLARRIIELSGYIVKNEENPNGDIEIRFIGLRPGEKLYEELLIGNSPQKTSHPRILKSSETYISWKDLGSKIEEIRVAVKERDLVAIRMLLIELVEGFPSNGLHSDWLALEKLGSRPNECGNIS